MRNKLHTWKLLRSDSLAILNAGSAFYAFSNRIISCICCSAIDVINIEFSKFELIYCIDTSSGARHGPRNLKKQSNTRLNTVTRRVVLAGTDNTQIHIFSTLYCPYEISLFTLNTKNFIQFFSIWVFLECFFFDRYLDFLREVKTIVF